MQYDSVYSHLKTSINFTICHVYSYNMITSKQEGLHKAMSRSTPSFNVDIKDNGLLLYYLCLIVICLVLLLYVDSRFLKDRQRSIGVNLQCAL